MAHQGLRLQSMNLVLKKKSDRKEHGYGSS